VGEMRRCWVKEYNTSVRQQGNMIIVNLKNKEEELKA
jgi:hypothetical protein